MSLPLEALTTWSLVLVAGVAALYDVREGRIPNGLTLGGLVLALALAAPGGLEAFGLALAGAGIAFLVALPVFMVGGLGGGDVKLLAAAGAFLGPARLPQALLITALAGGLLAGIAVIRRGAVRETAVNIKIILGTFGLDNFSRWKERGSGEEALTIDASGAVTVPYGVAISVGAVLARFL